MWQGVWQWGDRALTLGWAGQFWVCLGVVAYFRYLPVGVFGVGSDYAGFYLE